MAMAGPKGGSDPGDSESLYERGMSIDRYDEGAMRFVYFRSVRAYRPDQTDEDWKGFSLCALIVPFRCWTLHR